MGISSSNQNNNYNTVNGGDNSTSSGGNIFKKGLSSLTGLFQTKEEKMQIELKANATLIYNELTRFSRFFINLQLPYEQAYNLLA